jgi:hypothetical protein
MFKLLNKNKNAEILIRFNTKNNGTPLIWRIFIDNEEFLASKLSLIGKFHDIISLEGDVKKYNISCRGHVKWNNTEATIVSNNSKLETFIDWTKNDFLSAFKLLN